MITAFNRVHGHSTSLGLQLFDNLDGQAFEVRYLYRSLALPYIVGEGSNFVSLTGGEALSERVCGRRSC